MTNDGWGKAKGWGKPTGWTTQQAVDKAVEKLNLAETVKEKANLSKSDIEFVKAAVGVDLTPKADITKPNEGWEVWPNKTTYIEPDPPNITLGLDLGSEDKTVIVPGEGWGSLPNEIITKAEFEFLLARSVKLNLNSKIFTIDAIQVGDLAIWDDGEFFAISHVPTLAKFMNAVPTEDDKVYEHDSLVLWCTKVQRSHHEEWKILRGLTPQNHSTKNTEAAEAALRIREWCLSVPIE